MSFLYIADKQLVKVARLVGFFSLDGTVRVRSDVFPLSFLGKFFLKSSSVFLQKASGFPKKLKIKSLKYRRRELLLTFDTINDITELEAMSGGAFYVLYDELFSLLKDEGSPYALLDFIVFFDNKDSTGVLVDIVDNTKQELLVVSYMEKELYVPFVDKYVKNINYEARTLYLSIPDELFELN